jgi:hypothetical protein
MKRFILRSILAISPAAFGLLVGSLLPGNDETGGMGAMIGLFFGIALSLASLLFAILFGLLATRIFRTSKADTYILLFFVVLSWILIIAWTTVNS